MYGQGTDAIETSKTSLTSSVYKKSPGGAHYHSRVRYLWEWI